MAARRGSRTAAAAYATAALARKVAAFAAFVALGRAVAAALRTTVPSRKLDACRGVICVNFFWFQDAIFRLGRLRRSGVKLPCGETQEAEQVAE